MRSSFFAFNVAVSGMNTARNGSNTAVHNMANMTTPGFSRQQAVQRASMPLSTFNRTGMVGTGSEIIGIKQIRNPHLDTRYRNEGAVLGQQAMRKQHLTTLEASFGELGGLGINGSFELFFDSLQYFHTDPSNATLRNNFMSSITTMTRNIQDRAVAMQRQQSDINREIGGMATVINTIGDQIANLNNQIQRLEIRGDRANDLRDQRNLLIDQLSGLVNVDVSFQNRPAGEEMTLHINGQQFIQHDQVQSLTTVRRTYPLHPHDAGGLYDLMIGNNVFRTDARGFSGELRGLFEMRDGNAQRNPPAGQPGHDPNVGVGELMFNRAPLSSDHTGLGKDGNRTFSGIGFKGIPYYMARLNDLIQTVANAVNFGVDRNGDPIPGMYPGHVGGYNHLGQRVNQPLFGFDGMNLPEGWNEPPMIGTPPVANPNYNGNYIPLQVANPPVGAAGHNPLLPVGDLIDNWAHPRNNINIFNFALNPAIVADPDNLATAMTGIGEGGESNPDLLLGMMNLRNFPSLFREGTINDFITSVMAEMAMDLKDAYRFVESQTLVMEVVHNQRLEIKGVDMDEEMSRMIFFQHHFQASSRMISAINDIYDNMINRMGR